jgi:hypothetical protein
MANAPRSFMATRETYHPGVREEIFRWFQVEAVADGA